MSDAPNPYQPPAETSLPLIVADSDWASQPEGRISFQVDLTERDVRRYFPSPLSRGIFASFFVILLALFCLAITGALLVLIVVFVVLLLFVRTRMNWRMALRQSPRLLEPSSGHVTQQGIFMASDGCQGYSRWEDLHSIRTTRHCVLFSGENWRLVSMIIPWASFSDPAAAKQALESVLEQLKAWRPMALGDPRLLATPEDAPLFQPSGPHVAFDGDVTFGEIAASAPGKKLKRTVRRLIPFTAVLLIIAVLSILGGLTAALLLGIPLTAAAIGIIVQLSRHPLVRGNNDTVAFRSRGWFCESGFFLQSVTGQSLRQWRSVQRQWHDDAMLCVCLPGVSEGWFFFSRAQFAGDEDYRQACQWTAAGFAAAAT